MKYKAPAAATGVQAFYSWLPSTWPKPPTKFDQSFVDILRHIFGESMLGEIGNVIKDIIKSNGGLQFRGHVVAIALVCALDAVSTYGYDDRTQRERICKFIQNHFPVEYRPHREDIYKLYRNAFVHRWNLFQASILAGNEPIRKSTGTLSFGLLNVFDALQVAVGDVLTKLPAAKRLQANALRRYKELKNTARP